jgi:predicted nucleotidyltransferase
VSDLDAMRATLRLVASSLRDADVPFVLAGGFAAWACGAPPSDHDLDLMLKPADAERALEVLAGQGLRTERPPEEWLLKAFDGDVLVDLIFEPRAFPVDDALIERSPELEVEALRMRVLRPTDLLASKLLAMREHEVDYDGVLEVARALREQIDWAELREMTGHSPFAKAFMTLVEELEIADVA